MTGGGLLGLGGWVGVALIILLGLAVAWLLR